MFRPLRCVLRVYDRSIQKRPILTKALTSATLMGMGDGIAQYVEQNDNDKFCLDYKRTARMTVIGSAIGPTLHHWYGWLNRTVVATGSKGAVYKALYDQVLFAPVILGVLTLCIGAAEGKSVKELKLTMKHNYLEALKLNYYIWPVAIFVNFSYVPASFQVLFVSSVSMAWNAILSNIAHRTHHEEV